MTEEVINFPKSVKESKAEDEVNPLVPPAEGIKLISPNKTVYYISVTDDGSLITTVVE